MALLFHGTRGEETVRRIFREGLAPPGSGGSSSRDWAHRLTGAQREDLTFLSTSPVAGKGGDPVAFALGFPGPRLANPRRKPGFLVVVDLPPEALSTVRAVVPNGDLDAYIEACWLRDYLDTHGHFGVVLRMAQALVARGVPRDAGSIGRALEVRVKRAQSEQLFTSGEASAERWLPFLDAYARLVDVRWNDFATRAAAEAARSKLLRRYGVQLPEWIEEDSHSRHCMLCVGGLVEVVIGLKPSEDGDEAGDLELPCCYAMPVGKKLVLEGGLADILRMVRAYFEPRGPGALEAFLSGKGGKGGRGGPHFDDFCSAASAEDVGGEARLPALWRSDFGRGFSGEDLIRPDRQVLTEGVLPKYVLGAIALTDGRRLLGRFERGRGRRGTLASQLWSFAHELRDTRGEGPRIL